PSASAPPTATASATGAHATSAAAPPAATTASTPTATSAHALPRAAGDRAVARTREDASAPGPLRCRPDSARRVPPSGARHRPEPTTGHDQAGRVPGQAGGRPALSGQTSEHEGRPCDSAGALSFVQKRPKNLETNVLKL